MRLLFEKPLLSIHRQISEYTQNNEHELEEKKSISDSQDLEISSMPDPSLSSFLIVDLPRRETLKDKPLNQSEIENEKKIISKTKLLCNLCELLIDRVLRKLDFIPIQIRYLCKLVEQVFYKVFGKENEILRNLIFDIIYTKWFKKALQNPIEYGIPDLLFLPNFLNEKIYESKILSELFELFENVIFQRKYSELEPSFTELNTFIDSKKLQIDSYYQKLLFKIEIPKYDSVITIKQNLDDFVNISSVCISLQNLKLIYETFQSKFEELTSIHERCSKYISRLKFTFSESDKPSIFMPTEERFQCENLDNSNNEQIKNEEFICASHYVFLSDINIKEKKPVQNTEQIIWQEDLFKLLLEIDLTGVVNNSNVYAFYKEKYEVEILKLLRQIYDNPSKFLVSKENCYKVKILAMSLLDYFEPKGEKIARESIELLKGYYENTVKNTIIRQQDLEHKLRIIINSLHNRKLNIEQNCIQIQEKIISKKYAEQFMQKLQLGSLEITKEFRKENTSPTYSHNYKYNIKIDLKQEKTLKPSISKINLGRVIFLGKNAGKTPELKIRQDLIGSPKAAFKYKNINKFFLV